MFTQQTCRDRQIVEINRYVGKTRKWSKHKFFTKMIESFFGCEVVFGLMQGGPYILAEDKKSFEVKGYFIEMVKAMSANLNFNIDYCLKDEDVFSKKILTSLWVCR